MMSQSQDQRKSDRKRTLKKGTIVFSNRYCSANCTVRNESELGALLMVSDNHLIPSYIELNIYPGRTYRPAQVMWRTLDFIGVKFLDVLKGSAPAVPEDINQVDVIVEPEPAPPRPIEELQWDGVERRVSGVVDRRRSTS